MILSETQKLNLRFLPAISLIQAWRKGEISDDMLREHVTSDFLKKHRVKFTSEGRK